MRIIGLFFGALAFGLLAIIAIAIVCVVCRALFGPSNDDGEEFTDDDWDSLEQMTAEHDLPDEEEAEQCGCDACRHSSPDFCDGR